MSIDGKWNTVVKSPMGDQKSLVTFKQDGSALSGSGEAQGNTTQLQDGKIDGNAVSWKIAITSPMPMTLEFTGTVDGDNMSGNVKAGAFGSFPWTGTRA